VSIISDGFLTPLRVAFRQRFVTVSLNPVTGITIGLVALDGGGVQLYFMNTASGAATPVSAAVIPTTTNLRCKAAAGCTVVANFAPW
jgi:hypothetical protein